MLVELMRLRGHLHGQSIEGVRGCGGKKARGLNGPGAGSARAGCFGPWRRRCDARGASCRRLKFRVNTCEAANKAVGAVQTTIMLVDNFSLVLKQGLVRGVSAPHIPGPG